MIYFKDIQISHISFLLEIIGISRVSSEFRIGNLIRKADDQLSLQQYFGAETMSDPEGTDIFLSVGP